MILALWLRFASMARPASEIWPVVVADPQNVSITRVGNDTRYNRPSNVSRRKPFDTA